MLLDTGSSDKTIEVFEQWAQTQTGLSHEVGHFKWIDDFAAARTAADAMLSGCDWYSWADCDDEIHGAQLLRNLAAQSPPELAAWVADYDYAQDPNGNCICRLRRERLVRAGKGRWTGRVHEAQVLDGGVALIDGATIEWRHRKYRMAPGRNMKIFKEWVKTDPENPRVLGYLGFEEMGRGKPKLALKWFRRYLKLKTGWDEERAQVHRRYALALRMVGRTDEAMATAFEAVRLLPTWPDSYLTLAECHYELGEPQKAIAWARHVLERGVPDTALIIDPTDYTVQPRVLLAGALAQLGRLEDAVQVAGEALQLAPGHPLIEGPYQLWVRDLKREQTANRSLELAQVLVEHDEQLKALEVLRNVPHYAAEHPRVVVARAELAARIGPLLDPDAYREHYRSGGTKPEDMVEDPIAVGDVLPRCRFLLDRLLELRAERATA